MRTNLRYLVLFVLLVGGLQAHAQTGVLKGKVLDAINNKPLPFVNVVIVDTNIGGTTDMDGNFKITGLEPGFKRVKASFVGYEQKISEEVQVTNANPGYVEIKLEQTEQQLEEVQVKASPFMRSEESPTSLKKIGISEIEKAPGANRDISLVIQSYAGVSSSANFRNDIIVRGGGPSESSFYLDGVEIPNINHFATQGASGGPVGILNANFIREVEFYSGAFPANRGGALSAVFDFKQVDGNEEELNFSGAVGASEVAATIDGPIGENTTFIASARRSYLQFLFDFIGLPFLPTFNDFQFKTRTRFNDKNELILIGVGAIDDFELNTGIDNPDDQQEYILNTIPVNEQWSYTTGAVYKHYSENSYQTLVVSRNHLNNSSYKYVGNDEDSIKIYDYASEEIETKIRAESTNRMSGYKLNFGIGAELAEYSNETFQKRFYGAEVVEVNYTTALEVWQWNAFAQLSKSYFNDKLSLSFGVRTDANDYSSSMSNPLEQLSPRFSASYMLDDQWSVNFNIGRYFQLPPYTSLGYKENGTFVNKTNDLKYIQSDHYIAGVKYLLNEKTQLKAEGFYKQYSDYPFSVNDSLALANKGADFGVIGDEEVIPKATGRAYGVELEGRIKDLKGFNLNSSLTLVRSEFEDYSSGEMLPSAWDNRYIFLATAVKEFKNNWRAGVKFRYLGGLPYTPYDLKKSENPEAWDTRGGPFNDNQRINEKRFRPFQQLDLRIDKEFFFNKWSLNVYLDVQNVYNFKAEQKDIILRERDNQGSLEYDENGNYELRRVDNPTGTILPTIGLKVEF